MYEQGYSDAQEDAHIEYVYHTHASTCYTNVSDYVVSAGTTTWSGARTCIVCNESHGHRLWTGNVRLASGATYDQLTQCPSCGQYYKPDVSGSKFYMGTIQQLSCSIGEGSLEKAVISYD